MDLSFQGALNRLTEGETLGSVLLSLRPPWEVSVQRAAALVRSFDRETFSAFSPDADFEAFVKESFVEAVAGASSGTFRIRDDYRRTLLTGWAGSNESRGTNTNLAAFFHRRSPGGSADELFHLSALGPDREDDASRVLVQLFDEADAKFELSACAELLEIVSDPSHRHSQPFLDLVKQRRCRLRARQMWSEEFFRTTAYRERRPLINGFEALRSDQQRWILQIYAGGGMGKTMFVRWLLARHLVPKGIPCARLDFDFEQPSWLSQRPWRLVLTIARQLNEQMPDAPFTELVKEYNDAEAEEASASADATQDVERAQANDGRFNPEAFSRFTSGLVDARSAAPVIVFYTLERVSLYYQQDLLELIGKFTVVQHDYPQLRLILTGRYDLGGRDQSGKEHVEGFTAQSGAQTLSLPVRDFSEDEARDYLTNRRGIADEGRVRAIIKRSDGVPFKLSLFATMVQDDQTLDEQAILQIENVNVEFLIKRVVDQIKEPLAQWVLRHGVVPRQLTKTFLRDVMMPLLEQIQHGRTAIDNGRDELPEHLQNQERFKTGLLNSPAGTINVDDMWSTLNRYATDYSWISQSKDWPDTLVFHADVVDAMRTLLQKHEAFNRLHEDAIRYYEARALSDAANWTRWTREAIYHRFQRGGADAVGGWRIALEQAEALSAVARRDIAEEILRSEYVDDAGSPRLRRDDTPMVALDVLVSANFEAARAGVEAARLRRAVAGDQAWVTADRRIKTALRLQDGLPANVVSPIATVMVTAAIELTRKPEDALRMLEAASKVVTPDVASDFEELYGDAVRSSDPQAAMRHFQTALDRADDVAMRTPRVRSLAMKLVDCAAKIGDYEAVISVTRRALDAAEVAAEVELVGTARVRLAEALLTAGKIGEAVRVCRDDRFKRVTLSDKVRAALNAIDARAAVAAGDPLRAWRQARRDFQGVFDDHFQSDPSVNDATGLELKGELHAALFEFEEALAAWRDARHAWDILREPDGALRCVLLSVRTIVRETQHFAEAAQLMSEAERMSASLGSHALFAFRASEVERRAAAEPDHVVSVLDTILDAPNIAAVCEPAVAASAAKQAMALGHRVQDAQTLLASTLERVTPPAARLFVLNPRDRQIAASDAPDTLRPLLLAAVEAVERERKGVSTFVLDALESLRWLDKTRRARSMARSLYERLVEGDSLFSLLPLREVLQRLNFEIHEGLNAPSLGRKFLREFVKRPRVCGVFLLSETDIRVARDHWHPNKKTLTDIDRYLGDRASLPVSLKTRVEQVNGASAMKGRSVKPKPRPPADLISSAPQSAARVAPAGITADRPTISIAFGRRENRSVITRDGGPPLERSIGEAFKTLTGSSVKELTKRGLAAPVNLDLRLARDPGAAVDISRLLFDDNLLLDIGSATDLRIETGHSIYGGIPWELARLPDSNAGLLLSHPRIRCLYRCFSNDLSSRYVITTAQEGLIASSKAKLAVDGIMGPATHESVKKFQRMHGLPATGDLDVATHAAIATVRRAQEPSRPKSVVILRRGYKAQVTQVRGIWFSSFDVTEEYKRAGWQVITLEDPSMASIRHAVSQSHALVVHINVPVAEATRTGGLYLDIGYDTKESSTRWKSSAAVRRTQGLPVADLVDCLLGPSRNMSPVVVLDPPSVPTYTEAVRQLILRNAFASDVFQHSVAPAIIGTGLAQGDEAHDVGSALVAGFQAGQALTVVCDAMRRAARPNLQGTVQFSVATALYSHYADYAPWPSGTAAPAR